MFLQFTAEPSFPNGSIGNLVLSDTKSLIKILGEDRTIHLG
jgi:hypothetical protein